jgi:prepilin-type N-terminal cleavage/methylation domain-containing protein
MRRHSLIRALVKGAASVRSEAGFTLIELLVTMVVLLIVLGSLTGVLVTATKTESDMNNRFQTQVQARLALTTMTKELHCANAITDTSSVSLSSWTSAKSAIALTLPTGCSTGNGTVYWCTRANGSKWDLYRVTAWSGSCTGGVRWASGLTSSTPFSLPTSANLPGTVHFPLLHVALPVNALGSSAGSYQLSDDVAALNASRA